MDHSEITVARAVAAARNEEAVLAESTLGGERAVAWIRLGMIGVAAAGQLVTWLARGARDPLDPVGLGVFGGYLAFAVAVALLLPRVSPKAERARMIPLLISVADFAFVGALAVRLDGVEGQRTPEIAALGCAVVMCFSVARWGWVHVAMATLLAVATFTFSATMGGIYRLKPYLFAVAAYCVLGLLLWRTNVEVRRMFLNLRRRENLSRFLPKALVEQVLRHGDSLAPSHREVTVLFLDIRNFTSLSETMAPRDVLELLDGFLGEMARIVMAHDGTVNKFLGDGMLAFWGAPVRQERHALMATRAALDIRRRLEELNRDWEREGRRRIAVGVGLHSGTVAAGMVGSAEQCEYTVIGDTVNLAARIESLTKTLGTDVLLSEETCRRIEGRFACERLAEETVKGRQAPVVVYALRGAAQPREAA